jgi:uncharacterized protein YjbI with pentapeptide repeats
VKIRCGTQIEETEMNERFIGLQKENVIEITAIDEKTIIEDKHIMLFSEYLVEDELVIRNCFIEICGGGFMGGGGRLLIEDCEIKDPISRLISRDFKEATVRNTDIFWQDMFPCLRTADTDCELRLEGCRFDNPNLPEYEEGEEVGEICEIPVFKMPNARLKGCSFNGFPDMNVMLAAELIDCRFENCGLVTIAPDQDDEDERKLCGCEFNGISALSSVDCAIKKCRFTSCDCNGRSLVTTDSDVEDCEFSDVKLSNGAFAVLISGEAKVCGCKLDGVVTDRADGKTMLGIKKGGFLGLKKIEYDPVG